MFLFWVGNIGLLGIYRVKLFSLAFAIAYLWFCVACYGIESAIVMCVCVFGGIILDMRDRIRRTRCFWFTLTCCLFWLLRGVTLLKRIGLRLPIFNFPLCYHILSSLRLVLFFQFRLLCTMGWSLIFIRDRLIILGDLCRIIPLFGSLVVPLRTAWVLWN